MAVTGCKAYIRTVAVKETTCTTEAVMAVEMVVIEEVTMQLSDIVMVIAVV